MSTNKDDAQKNVPDQGGSQQGSQQATSGIQSNFAHASPESMVNAPGAAQSGAGSIAGKQADEIPGGVASQIQASRNQQSGQGIDASPGPMRYRRGRRHARHAGGRRPLRREFERRRQPGAQRQLSSRAGSRGRAWARARVVKLPASGPVQA
jgi:hypothetical protein